MVMTKKIFFTFISFFLFSVFISCSSTGLNKVYVTNTKSVSLLPPSSMKGSLECYEYFSGSFGNQTFAMNCFFSSDNEGITILMLNDFGVQMGVITYDGESAVIDSSLFPSNLKVEYILLDIQNAYYNAEELSKHYKNFKLNFAQEISEDGIITRKIMNKKNLIEEIIINKKSIVIKNHLRGYQYELTGADDE